MTYFVTIFKLAIVRASILYCVIGQMDKSVLDIFYVVLATASSKITILVKEALQVAVDSSC